MCGGRTVYHCDLIIKRSSEGGIGIREVERIRLRAVPIDAAEDHGVIIAAGADLPPREKPCCLAGDNLIQQQHCGVIMRRRLRPGAGRGEDTGDDRGAERENAGYGEVHDA